MVLALLIQDIGDGVPGGDVDRIPEQEPFADGPERIAPVDATPSSYLLSSWNARSGDSTAWVAPIAPLTKRETLIQ